MPHHRPSVMAWLVLVLLLSASPAEGGIPGGILDETGSTAFLVAGKGIDAVALARGELLWSTAEAQVPLLVAGDRLYALALAESNGLYVRGFDLANKGKLVYQSARIEFPRWVTTAEAADRSFRWTWRLEKTILLLNWEAAAWAETGPRKEAVGEVRIDLLAGTVKAGEVGLPTAHPAVPMPERIAGLAVRWHRLIGSHLHALVLDETATEKDRRKQRFVLRVWNEETGKEGTAHELARGSRLVVLAGLDGFHLWLRDAAPSPDEPGAGEGRGAAYQWSVFSVLDGHLVARVPFLAGTQQATLIGDRAYILTSAPLREQTGEFTRRVYTLIAVDLQSGKTALATNAVEQSPGAVRFFHAGTPEMFQAPSALLRVGHSLLQAFSLGASLDF